MSVELIFGLIFVVLIAAILFFNRSSKSLDINQDGKVDLNDAKAAVENTVAGVKATADVNKDGKVDAGDVKAVATKVKAAANRGRKGPGQTSAKTPAKKPAVKVKTNRSR
jgi:hypothetical protein